MAQRRWIQLATTWSQSGWLAESGPEVRLCWVELLCHVKAHGYNGRAKALSDPIAARQWGVTRNAVTQLIEAAQADEALTIDGDEWVVENWKEYQGDKTAAERNRQYRQRLSEEPEGEGSVPSSGDDTEVTRNAPQYKPIQEKPTDLTDNTTAAVAAKSRPNSLPAAQQFVEFWAAYPRRAGGNPRRRAEKAWTARIRDGESPDEILAGLHRYRHYVEVQGKVGTEFVKQAATFLGKDRHWEEPWDPPNGVNGNGISQADRKLLEHRQRLESVNLNMGVWNDQ